MKFSLLVADDDNTICWALKEALSSEGYEVFTASDSQQTEKAVEEHGPDLVLLDLRLPGVGGMEILRRVCGKPDAPLVIMITAFGEVETAVGAMKLGARDYVTKPFNLEELKLIIRNNLEALNLKYEVSRLRRIHDKVEFVVGANPVMRQIHETIRKVAASRTTTVLIEGQSGTGKELVARSVHQMSERRAPLFVAINCTALPENLLEAELFGSEKGAFTDARQDRKGLFELADGGSLFLDEIGDMSLTMQAKMLRALQERKIRRVGGTRDIGVDIRVIASTNKNLDEEVRQGRFREDLYYRLNVVRIQVPPLRERREDLPALVDHFVAVFNREFGKNVRGLSPRAFEIVNEYPWPGNIRELRNVLERAILLESHDLVLPEHLNLPGYVAAVPQPAPCRAAASAGNGGGAPAPAGPFNIDEATADGLEGVEKYVIGQMLSATGWNKSLTAEKLRINRTTLYNKIKKYGFEDSAESCPAGPAD